MASSFGWAFSPTISGWLQVNYGFAPAFVLTIILYVISISLYWGFFWRKKPGSEHHPNNEIVAT
jgi:dipeptide/tripeptide permease